VSCTIVRCLLVAGALVTGGCASRVFQLSPVPRAGDGTAPVKAQVRQIAWAAQAEDGDLFSGAQATVEIDLYNADPARTFVVGPPRLVGRQALGGPEITFQRVAADEAEPAPGGGLVAATASHAFTLKPHESRTVWAAFTAPDADRLRGTVHLSVVVPVDGQAALEIAIADPVPGGPRWRQDRPVAGGYTTGGLSFLWGTETTTVMEPIGLSYRMSHERWVIGIDARYAYLYQESLAGGPPSMGFSLLAQLSWQPWHGRIAPYMEAGSYTGREFPPSAYAQAGARLIELPRVGAGILIVSGPRLGGSGALPFDRPLSPQHRGALRVGYTRWFNTGERGGTGGLQLSFETGFGP
jgi:hypothetical protein